MLTVTYTRNEWSGIYEAEWTFPNGTRQVERYFDLDLLLADIESTGAVHL